MTNTLELKKFSEISVKDKFFDSLKSDYAEFASWFAKKNDESAFVVTEAGTGALNGFVYVKIEDGPIVDVEPALPAARWLKIGTLKINAHGTKLGERVLKKVFDKALSEKAEGIYVTVFSHHSGLLKLFQKYGFLQKGKKKTKNGEELVLCRMFSDVTGDIIKDYPLVHQSGVQKWLLAIYPEYHTVLLPDSKLHTEKPHIVEDLSQTNTIHKIYIGKTALTRMKRGDAVVMYRTSDGKGAAYYRSVATSVCVVEEVRRRSDFPNAAAFVDFALPHSVFDEATLTTMYNSSNRLYAAQMTYNAAFQRRPIRGELLNDVGISEQPRWDLRQLTDGQFQRIVELGQVDEGLVVD